LEIQDIENAQRPVRGISWKARIDLALGAVLLLAVAWCHYEAALERKEAILRYGHNVDSGAYIAILGTLFLFPFGLMFLAAGIGLWRRWRIARVLHWMVWIAVLGVIVVFFRFFLFTGMMTTESLRAR
jgi:hypothetical protein